MKHVASRHKIVKLDKKTIFYLQEKSYVFPAIKTSTPWWNFKREVKENIIQCRKYYKIYIVTTDNKKETVTLPTRLFKFTPAHLSLKADKLMQYKPIHHIQEEISFHELAQPKIKYKVGHDTFHIDIIRSFHLEDQDFVLQDDNPNVGPEILSGSLTTNSQVNDAVLLKSQTYFDQNEAGFGHDMILNLMRNTLSIRGSKESKNQASTLNLKILKVTELPHNVKGLLGIAH